VNGRRQSGNSCGRRHALASGVRDYYEEGQKYSWIVYRCALMVGALTGYIIAVAGTQPGAGSAVRTDAAASGTSAPAPLVDEGALTAYRDILARDPKNLQAAASAGNLLYDAHRYIEAIPFYQQAFALNDSDINVSTDLGTALWYAGRPDDALAQYERSLKISPVHAQTLYNVGIVRADGKHDYRGAVEAWERLLTSSPTYQNAAGVRDLLADARLKSNVVRQ
jgi:cytochrome c-type biogenesis protein CcmH/NrfG